MVSQRVRCDTVECAKAILYYNWLYFLWHGIIGIF